MAEVKEKTISYCGLCGIIYPEHPDMAAKCCTCSRCGKVKKDRRGRPYCLECEKIVEDEAATRLFEKAEKLEDWDGPVVVGDHYFPDIDAYVEYLEDDLGPGDPWPKWVNTCLIEPFPELDFQDLLDNLVENHGLEDFGVDDIDVPGDVMDALEKACKDFNMAAKASKQNVSWHENIAQVVRVPPDTRKAA